MERLSTEKGLLLALVVLMMLVLFSPSFKAEEGADTKLPDKFMVRGGWAYVFGATTTAAVGGPILGGGHQH